MYAYVHIHSQYIPNVLIGFAVWDSAIRALRCETTAMCFVFRLPAATLPPHGRTRGANSRQTSQMVGPPNNWT
jgi:hypothetical protein